MVNALTADEARRITLENGGGEVGVYLEQICACVEAEAKKGESCLYYTALNLSDVFNAPRLVLAVQSLGYEVEWLHHTPQVGRVDLRIKW